MLVKSRGLSSGAIIKNGLIMKSEEQKEIVNEALQHIDFKQLKEQSRDNIKKNVQKGVERVKILLTDRARVPMRLM